MKLESFTVNKIPQYDTSRPQFIFHVDEVPKFADLRYEARVFENTTLFYANHEGLVDFMMYSGPGQGYGGAEFDIQLIDGSHRVLKGPWSSRAGVMHAAGFPPCIEGVVYSNPSRPHYHTATVEWVLSQGLRVCELTYGDETYYEVLTMDGKLYKALTPYESWVKEVFHA